ncbi:MAG: ribonuclease J [Clostridia bacterium]|nr:ribonuclease J [Clostridia bacterium]
MKESFFAKEKLKIIPLGGLEEVGKNITVFEYGNDIFVLDCGLGFPEDDMLGVDLVIPDITYLEKNINKIKGLVITHGHEDHIGSIPYFLKKINVPIYATKLTVGLIKAKLEEHNLPDTIKIKCVEAGNVINLGKFKIEFIHTTHSIADSVAVAVTTPVGTVIHTGDFKVDYTPIDGKPMDFQRFAEYGKQGVTLLMSDSTNVERPGYTMSESNVGQEFDKLFMNSKKRIIVATFASNIHRMQQIVNSAVKFGRKVSMIGRSMLRVMDVARELGYLTAPENTFIDIDKIGLYNPEQLVIMTTGTQGEPMAGLSRMSQGEHKKVTITENDMVILSSSPIPGNEKSIGKVIDALQKIGAEVIYNQLADVHVSGHACQEELKLMLCLTKPKFFMPVHGEYRFLRQHKELAKSVGLKSENIFISQNGRILEIDENGARLSTQVPSGIVLVDGLGVGDVGNIVLKDRQLLSENGMILVVFSLEENTGILVGGPDIITRGFVYVRESEDLVDEIREFAKEKIMKLQESHVTEWSQIKSNLRQEICDFVYKKTKRNPMVLPIITEVKQNR